MGDQNNFPGFDAFDDVASCKTHFSDDVDDPGAFCRWLADNGKDALSDPEAEEVLAGLGVEFVSGVDTPAQDSQWLIAKDVEGPDGDDHRWKSEAPLVVFKDGDASKDEDGEDERQITFAPVLIPGEADKQGDVIPEFEIESAAHNYLKDARKVDTDHDLLDGKGDPVESYTLKEDRTFTLPDGSESRVYPKGTWIMGVQWTDKAWKRIKSGELNGLSIYGGASPIPVDDLVDRDAAKSEPNRTAVAMSTSKGVLSSEEVDALRDIVDTMADEVEDDASDITVYDLIAWATDDPDEDDGDDAEDAGEEDEDDGSESKSTMDEEEEDTPADEAGTEDEAKDESGGDGAEDAVTDGIEEIKSTIKSVDEKVTKFDDRLDTVEDRVSDLETEVKDEDGGGANDRMESEDEGGDRMKGIEKALDNYFGVDDEAERKAIREQVSKSDTTEDDIDVGFNPDADTEVPNTGNPRMTGGDD